MVRLVDIAWKVNKPVSTARLVKSDGTEVRINGSVPVVGLKGSKITLRLYAVCDPEVRITISAPFTLRKVLYAVKKLARLYGYKKLGDHVFFEGLRRVRTGVYEVELGS